MPNEGEPSIPWFEDPQRFAEVLAQAIAKSDGFKQHRRWYEDSDKFMAACAVVVALVALLISGYQSYLSAAQSKIMAEQNRVAAQAGLYGQAGETTHMFLVREHLKHQQLFSGKPVADADGGYSGKKEEVPFPEDLDVDEFAVVELLAEVQTDLFENVLQHLSVLNKDDADSWEKYIQVVYERSPTMRKFLIWNKDSYTAELLRKSRAVEIEEKRLSSDQRVTGRFP